MDQKKNIVSDAAAVLCGSVLFGLSLALFLTPCGVVMGGATGAATTLHVLTRIPVGVGILLFNLPLLILNIRIGSLRGMARTIAGVAATSLFSDLLAGLPAATADPLLGAVFGGALMGAGAGIMLLRGYTTGGSDLAAYLIHRRARRLPIGTLIMLIDAVIVLGSAVLLRNYSGIIWSAAAVIAYSMALDGVMYGLGRAKLSLIVSERYAEIGDAITQNINRGATMLRGTGWYTGNERNVVMCVLKRTELFTLEKLVKEIDPKAFMIVTDAAEVLGSGFEDAG
ncbi:MAG: YitT family protein [Eubacteriales bacterium]